MIEVIDARGIRGAQLLQRLGDFHGRGLQDHQSKFELAAGLFSQDFEAASLRSLQSLIRGRIGQQFVADDGIAARIGGERVRIGADQPIDLHMPQLAQLIQ